ncbi:hypothetical protein E5D57_013305 [Metarhizium anisopliae]|nr:hypothetical protein E5D57_013305 [Metarhizium anisopliae]
MEARIQEALRCIDDFPDAKVAKVAREFGVPRNRLRYRFQGRPPKVGQAASNLKLSQPEEAALCRYIDRLDHINLAVRSEFVTHAANYVLRERTGHADVVVGTKWASRFLKHHGYFKKLQKSSILSTKLLRTSSGPISIIRVSGRSYKTLAYLLITYGTWTRPDFERE